LYEYYAAGYPAQVANLMYAQANSVTHYLFSILNKGEMTV